MSEQLAIQWTPEITAEVVRSEPVITVVVGTVGGEAYHCHITSLRHAKYVTFAVGPDATMAQQICDFQRHDGYRRLLDITEHDEQEVEAIARRLAAEYLEQRG